MTSENGDSIKFKEAEECKIRANEFFKNGDYNHAIVEYEKAIEILPLAVYYSNRSFAYLKTECFGYALNDADQAISLDPNYVKGYYRRASANMALGKFKLAQKDFETVVKIYKNDKDAKMKLEECRKIVHRRAFEKAIAVEEKKSTLDSTDINEIIIESSYDGPHLEEIETTSDKCKFYENYIVTESFMLHLIQYFKQQKKLHRKYALIILKQIKDYLCQLPSLIDIDVPENSKFTICGDIHGQYFDLCNIFEMNGLPSKENPYLFNGDFVDRGSFSVECIFTLLGFKLLYPNHFYMARGNHESENMNQMYGFEGEVKAKYSANVVEMFTEVFNWLPLAHLINKRILTMHGGLFRDEDVTLEHIKNIDRNRQPPETGIMCDLLWSDPQMSRGRAPSKRGVGCQFGPDVTDKFCNENNIDYIVRSHEVKDEGYELTHQDRCITVFSAPNYCDTMHNRGAYINIKGSYNSKMTPQFFSFKEVPHPNVRPMAYANSLLSMLA